MASESCFATTQCAFGTIHLTARGTSTDIPMEDCPASMHHFQWMSAWTRMIFVRGTSMKSEIK